MIIINNADVFELIEHKYALFGLFFAFHNRLQATGDSFYEEITCKQFFLMACMNLFSDEPPTMNDLAKTMGCSRQNVKQIVKSLENKGFLQISRNENDKRKQQIFMTEKAFSMAEKYRKKETEFMDMLFSGISDEEIDSTYSVISKIENNLKSYGGNKNE